MKFFPLKYLDIYFDEQHKLLEYRWKPNTEEMTESEYRQSIEELMTVARNYEPRLLLGNFENQNFAPTVRIQNWLVEEILPELQKIGIEKFAVVESKDFIVGISYNQTFSEAVVYVEFFKNRTDAINWLLNNHLPNTEIKDFGEK